MIIPLPLSVVAHKTRVVKDKHSIWNDRIQKLASIIFPVYQQSRKKSETSATLTKLFGNWW